MNDQDARIRVSPPRWKAKLFGIQKSVQRFAFGVVNIGVGEDIACAYNDA